MRRIFHSFVSSYESSLLDGTDKMVGGFIYVSPMNYLKAFLLDCFKGGIKTLMDLLLIRGKWATVISSQHLSDAYHAVMDVSSTLIQFDERLFDEGDKGITLKNLTYKSDQDKNSITILRKLLKETNDSACAADAVFIKKKN